MLWFSDSLRVNLDMGKIVYSWVIRRDSKIPGTVVRSSTIPEQLGRISYLLTDKTGEFPVALSGFKVEEGAWNLFLEVLEMHATALLFSSSFDDDRLFGDDDDDDSSTALPPANYVQKHHSGYL